MKRKAKKKPVLWLREDIEGRAYHIDVKLTRGTGLVLSLESGCRHWHDFTEALAHYAGGGRYSVGRWRENAHIIPNSPMGTNAMIRDCSVLALARLATRVYAYQRKRRR
jgi:hypothetical protein